MLRVREGIVPEYSHPTYVCPKCGAKSEATNLGLAGGLAGFMFGAFVLASVLVEDFYRIGSWFIVYVGLPTALILATAGFFIVGARLVRWKPVKETAA